MAKRKLRTPIELSEGRVRISELGPHPKAPRRDTYENELKELQLQMLRVQQAWHASGQRGIVVLQGWDASGKGGALRRLTEKLDPRGYRVHSISAPTPAEQGRHYLWRFWQRIPQPGGLAIFDRSWYGRVLVERVEGFASEDQWRRAYDEINEFEHTLIDDGVRIAKFFLHITADEQLERFSERLNNPYKRWKLTSEDIRNRERWADYVGAIDDMIERTSTVAAPWTVVLGDHKRHARLEVLRRCVAVFGDGIDLDLPRVDLEVIREAEAKLGIKVDLGS
ncbi:MAG: polyphosphate kinase [Myxococcota bacterium]